MAFDLSDPEGYLGFIQMLRGVADQIDVAEMPRDGVSVRLWTPTMRASEVAQELTDLDLDARRVAAWQPRLSPRWRRRVARPYFFEELVDLGLVPGVFPYAFPIYGAPEPVRPAEGGLEVVRAQRRASLDVDLMAVGVVLSMLVDVPTLFFASRIVLRRLPVRIVWRRSADDPGADEDAEQGEAYHGTEQSAAIEARRLIRRVTLRMPDGSELIEEDFAPPSDEAA